MGVAVVCESWTRSEPISSRSVDIFRRRLGSGLVGSWWPVTTRATYGGSAKRSHHVGLVGRERASNAALMPVLVLAPFRSSHHVVISTWQPLHITVTGAFLVYECHLCSFLHIRFSLFCLAVRFPLFCLLTPANARPACRRRRTAYARLLPSPIPGCDAYEPASYDTTRVLAMSRLTSRQRVMSHW